VCFSSSGIEENTLISGTIIHVNRTPDDFTSSNDWSVAVMYDDAVGSDGALMLAIPSSGQLYSGVVDQQLPFVPHEIYATGVFVTQPYAIYFGTNGSVTWSNANEPLNIITGDAGSDRVTARDIVAGANLPSGSGPGGLLFSEDSVVRMDWVGGQAIFRFTTLTSSSSIMNPHTVVEFNGVYYWVGDDRFFACDGQSVKTLPNASNLNWFFDNLNPTQKSKVWATKNPKFGEIIWHFPFGDSTECNKTVVFNTIDNCWYDYSISRSAGAILNGQPIQANGTNLYVHEEGTDRVEFGVATALPSHITTSNLVTQLMKEWVRVKRIEPDFVCTDGLSISVYTKEFAQSDPVFTPQYPVTSSTEKIDLRLQGRYVGVRVDSNASGSDYQFGKPLIHIELGDARS
jgi:hypothetical protein